MAERTVSVLLDVGGTEIKAALYRDGVLSEITSYPSYSDRDSGAVLANFARVIETEARGEVPMRVSLAVPGPFDCENGVSLIRGVSKYDSIYGIDITREIKKLLPFLADTAFDYMGDIEAFALGAAEMIPDARRGRIMCLCIGTGAGSAFLSDGGIIRSGVGVPENGWIYSLPYRDSAIDDYISVRGLGRLAEREFGRVMSGKELSALCVSGNVGAMRVYRRFGEELCEVVGMIDAVFRPDGIVFGGQITKAFEYFGEAVTEYCEKRGAAIHICPDTSEYAMRGLLRNK